MDLKKDLPLEGISESVLNFNGMQIYNSLTAVLANLNTEGLQKSLQPSQLISLLGFSSAALEIFDLMLDSNLIVWNKNKLAGNDKLFSEILTIEKQILASLEAISERIQEQNTKDRKNLEVHSLLVQIQNTLFKAMRVLLRKRVAKMFQEAGVPEHEGIIIKTFNLIQSRVYRYSPEEDTQTPDLNQFETFLTFQQALKYDFCLKSLDTERLVQTTQRLIVQLSELSSIKGPNARKISLKFLQIIQLLCKIITSAATTANVAAAVGLENLSESRRTATKLHRIIMDKAFFKGILEPKLYQKSEITYQAVRFYVMIRLKELLRVQNQEPEHFSELTRSEEFLDFMDKCCEFYKEPWESFYEIYLIRELCSNEELQKTFLIEKGLLRSLFETSFNGKSSMMFCPNYRRAYTRYVHNRMIIRLLRKILVDSHEGLINQFILKSNELDELSKSIDTQKRSLKLNLALLEISKFRPYFEEMIGLMKGWVGCTFDTPMSERLRGLKLKFISSPYSLLLTSSSQVSDWYYWYLKVRTKEDLNEDLELHFRTLTKSIAEISKIDFESCPIFQDENVFKITNFGARIPFNLKNWHLFETPMPCLRVMHFIKFALRNSFTHNQNIQYFFTARGCRTFFNKLKAEVDSLKLTPNGFITLIVKLVEAVGKNYIRVRMGLKEQIKFLKTYQNATEEFVSHSPFVTAFQHFLWRGLNYLFLALSDDGCSLCLKEISPFLQYTPISTYDLASDQILREKYLHNKIVSSLLAFFFSERVARIRNRYTRRNMRNPRKVRRDLSNFQEFLILGLCYQPQQLEIMANRSIAVSSTLPALGFVCNDEYDACTDRTLSKLIHPLFFSQLKLKKLFPEKEGTSDMPDVIRSCLNGFDYFIENIHKIVQNSVLFYSNSTRLETLVLNCYKRISSGKTRKLSSSEKLTSKIYIGWEDNERYMKLCKIFSELKATSYDYIIEDESHLDIFHKENTRPESTKDLLSSETTLKEESKSEVKGEHVQFTETPTELASFACCEFFKDSRPDLAAYYKNLLKLSLAIRNYLFLSCDEVYYEDKKVHELPSKFTEFFIENLKLVSSVKKNIGEIGAQTGKDLINQLFIFSFEVGFLLSSLMIRDMLETHERSNRLNFIAKLRGLLPNTLKVWSNLGDIEPLNGERLNNLFAVIYFLVVINQEEDPQYEFMKDKEICSILGLSCVESNLSSSFVAHLMLRIISKTIPSEILFEHKLNEVALTFEAGSQQNLNDFLRDILKKVQISTIPEWLFYYIDAVFATKLKNGGLELVITGKKTATLGKDYSFLILE